MTIHWQRSRVPTTPNDFDLVNRWGGLMAWITPEGAGYRVKFALPRMDKDVYFDDLEEAKAYVATVIMLED